MIGACACASELTVQIPKKTNAALVTQAALDGYRNIEKPLIDIS